MRKPWKKGAAACTAMLLFLFFAFSVQAASLLSDRAISNVTGGVIHPFAMDPVVVYVENQSRATMPADDFYWGDADGMPAAPNPGFLVYSMPDTDYTLSFPNIYATTTGYEDVPSRMPPAKQPALFWQYDPTDVTDVTLSHFPPAAMRQFVDHGWGALLIWADDTDTAPLMWNGNVLVPPDTAFVAAANSTMEIFTPRLCLTVATAPPDAGDNTRPDLDLARRPENQIGILCIENLKVRVDGGITGPDSVVEKVIVVYPEF